MLSVEVVNGDNNLIREIIDIHPDFEVVEINSFGSDTIVQFIIPITAILAPVISPVLLKLLENDKVSIKMDGIEISGGYRKVKEIMMQFQAEEKQKHQKKTKPSHNKR